MADRATGLTHAEVQTEVNRLTGIERVSEATVDDPERRLKHAGTGLARRRPPASR